MKGTEKQVKWAEELRGKIVATLEQMIDLCPKMCPTQEVSDANIAGLRARIDRLNAEDVHAGDIIDLFKGVRFSGDVAHDFNEIAAVYRVTIPNTAGQHAILMK